MSKYIFRNAHIIADNTHEFINGAILVDDNHISDIYPHDNKIKRDISEYKSIDLDGLIVMPGFFDVRTTSLNKNGTTSIIYEGDETIEDKVIRGIDVKDMESAKRLNPLSITIPVDTLSVDDLQYLRDKGIKVTLTPGSYLTDDYDHYYDLFDIGYKPLDIKGNSPINKAIFDGRYKELCLSGVDDNVIRLALNNIARNRIMLCSKNNSESMLDYAKKLYQLGYSYTDILSMTSLNGFKYYGLDKRYGSIAKGKIADLLVLDDDLNLIKTCVGGVIND